MVAEYADSRYEVKSSPDYLRIRALPQRDIDLEECELLADQLTPLLTTPLGKRRGVRLKPLQALAFHEIHLCRGGYLGLPVGEGKTLICFLLAYILSAKRAVLIIPASLRDKTYAEFAAYAQDWISPSPGIRIITYTDLTRDPKLLERIKPDLIILDEADKARDQERSAAQRLGRYIGECKICQAIKGANAPACKHLPMVVTMTGTGTRFSITDFSHFLIWCLKDQAPVPLDPRQLEEWASALDERKPRFGQREKRIRPGVLINLAKQLDISRDFSPQAQAKQTKKSKYAGAFQSDVMLAREAFQWRLRRTPGVIIVDGSACDQPLTIQHVAAPEDELLNGYFDKFRGDGTEENPGGETPDGDVLTDAFSEYRFEGELGCGMFYYWDPPPPDEWRDARRACFKFVRNRIISSRRTGRPLDTEGAVLKAYRNHPLVEAWLAIKPTFKPNSVPRWVSGSVVDWAQGWAKKHTGLIFTKQSAVGETIAEESGLLYYGSQGKNKHGVSIERADPSKSAVLSIDANLRGRNLQAWHNMALIGCPQAATILEQLLGREHRYGQLHPVHVWILLTSGGSKYAFDMALREAAFVYATQGQAQKILRARVECCAFPSKSSRWMKKSLDETFD